MMHGTFNSDTFCRVLEKIFSERDNNVEVNVSLIPEEKAEEIMRIQENNIQAAEEDKQHL